MTNVSIIKQVCFFPVPEDESKKKIIFVFNKKKFVFDVTKISNIPEQISSF